MGSPTDDLDRFLKTEGIRMLSEANTSAQWEPLTEEDIANFRSIDLDNLDEYALDDLMEKAEDLLEQLYLAEPWDEDCRQHNLWEDRTSETIEFISRIRGQMRKLDKGQEGGNKTWAKYW